MFGVSFTTDFSNLEQSFIRLKPLPGSESLQIKSFSLCFRISPTFITNLCNFEARHSIRMITRDYTANYGFLTLKEVSYMYTMPEDNPYVPKSWYHICFSYEGQQHKLVMMVNGNNVLEATDPKALAPRNLTNDLIQDFLFGRCYDPGTGAGAPYQGLVSDFQMWSSVLSADVSTLILLL